MTNFHEELDTSINILVLQALPPLETLHILNSGQGLFGVPFLFVLEFLGKVLLLFVTSALVSKILRLDKAYDNLHQHKNS